MCNRCDLIQEFNAKARCMHTQYKAHQLMDQLTFITRDEWQRLITEWSHFSDCGEGAAALDYECLQLREKYHLTRRVHSGKKCFEEIPLCH